MPSPAHVGAKGSACALPPGTMLGRYEVLRLLSVGGMAEIYLARAEGIAGFEKLVVIKRILPHFAMQADYVEMFLAEARLSAILDHPNIAQVYDIGQETGNYYYAMEYVRGADVRQLMKAANAAGEAVPLHVAISIGLGMCAGLDHAHHKTAPDGRPLGIVHRDVSLSNVLLSYDGAVKVADFGVAKVSALDHHTRTGSLKGKIGYMSPEQCRGEPLDRRSDIFSIGIILYEITTGRRLFRSEDGDFAILQKIVKEDASPPSRLRSHYPPELEAIVMRALQRDRDARYQTARALQLDLERFARANRLPATPTELGDYLTRLIPPLDDVTPLPRGLRLADLPVEIAPVSAPPIASPITSNGRLLAPVELPLAPPEPTVQASAYVQLVLDDVISGPVAAVDVPPAKPPPLLAEPEPAVIIVPRPRGRAAVAAVALVIGAVAAFAWARMSAPEPEATGSRSRPSPGEPRLVVAEPGAAAATGTEAATGAEAATGTAAVAGTVTDAMTATGVVPAPAVRPTRAAASVAPPVEARHTRVERDERPAPAREHRDRADRDRADRDADRADRDRDRDRDRADRVADRRASRDEPPPERVAAAETRWTDTAALPPPEPAPAPPPDAAPPVRAPDAGVPSPPPPRAAPPARVVAPDPATLDATVALARIDVKGPLQDSEIRRGADRVISAFRGCYRTAARAAGRAPAATVRVSFEIDSTRAARRVSVAGAPLSGMKSCLAGATSKIRTRIAPDVGNASVTLVLTFDPVTP